LRSAPEILCMRRGKGPTPHDGARTRLESQRLPIELFHCRGAVGGTGNKSRTNWEQTADEQPKSDAGFRLSYFLWTRTVACQGIKRFSSVNRNEQVARLLGRQTLFCLWNLIVPPRCNCTETFSVTGPLILSDHSRRIPYENLAHPHPDPKKKPS
jgi:hypothetical protein